MKKLAIVYHFFAHYREPVLRQLCEHLVADYRVELVGDEEADTPGLKTIDMRDFCDGQCDFRRVRNVWMGPWLWQVGLLGSIISGKSDIIIFLGQFNFVSTWIAVPLAVLMGKRTYFWSHGVYGNERFLKRFVRISFYRLAHGMLLYGDHAKQLLVEAGMREDRLHVIYNSLDYKLQRVLRDQKQESIVPEIRRKFFGEENANQPYLIFVGRLTAVKRLDLLLAAVAELNKQATGKIYCLLVGDGPEMSSLVEQVEREHLTDRVKFCGACHDEKVLSDLIYAADICVAPGNVGLTAMHSLVYGTPVITHGDISWQMPECEAITPGVSGDFFDRDDARDLAAKIRTLLDRTTADRASVRSACCEVIDQKYNPEFQAKMIANAIEEGV